MINNYRELKKILNSKNKSNFKTVFILISLGSLNVFSLSFKKIIDSVNRDSGARYNELTMSIGEHLINTFLRLLKKDLKKLENLNNLSDSLVKDDTLDKEDLWEINPIDLFHLISDNKGIVKTTEKYEGNIESDSESDSESESESEIKNEIDDVKDNKKLALVTSNNFNLLDFLFYHILSPPISLTCLGRY